MIEIICLGLAAAALIGIFYLQVTHARERSEGVAEAREMYLNAAESAQRLASEAMIRGQETQAQFLTSMEEMYKAYVNPVMQAASVVKAASTTEGVMAAGTLAQTAAALDPDLQARMLEVQQRMAAHTPWAGNQPQEPTIPKIPDIIQDPNTGEIMKRMV